MFTLGPWTMRNAPDDIDNNGLRFWIDGAVQFNNAVTGPPIGNIYAKDDARLVAAAPELLKALVFAEAQLLDAEISHHMIGDAIAKAKG